MQRNLMAEKRFFTAIPLALLFGIICTLMAINGTEVKVWGTPLMWTIITDRLLIGIVIALAGAYRIHPVLRFHLHPISRGFVLGCLVSLPLATASMIIPPTLTSTNAVLFWTIFLGGIYGAIIDIIATKFGGDGVKLTK